MSARRREEQPSLFPELAQPAPSARESSTKSPAARAGGPRSREQASGRADEGPPAPAPALPEHEALARRLPERLRLGSSSWAFPGWAGLVFARPHSKEALAARGLPAYARHPLLRSVGLDRTFYRPESVEGLRALAEGLPAGFRLLVKAPSLLTRPALPPSRSKAPGSAKGRWEDNPLFLDAEYASREAVRPLLEGLGEHAGPLVFQFSPLPRFRLRDPAGLIARLHAFLRALPRGPLYALELRNPELLRSDYADALADAGAVHALNVHPTMPAPRAQAARLGERAFARGLVVRWMLGHDQEYEDAKSRYAPFDRLMDPDPESRAQIAELAAAALRAGREATVIINNKAEGSAPLSVFAFAEELAGRL